MVKNNEVNVRLEIDHFDCHPDEITRIIGLTPTYVWIAGQQGPCPPGPNVPYKFNGWFLNSPLDGSSELEEQVSALIGVITTSAGRFQSLPDKASVMLSCSVYAYQYMPAIYFTPAQVQFLASIGAEIDVDVYDLSSVQADEEMGGD